MKITVKPLSKETIEDFLFYFDNIAFTDNHNWAGCYCYFYHSGYSSEQWIQRTGESNRQAAVELIEQGKMKGYLAYHDGKPVGWCNANDKLSYERLKQYDEIWDGEEGRICSIVCFIIAPEHRRKGVAVQLLRQICKDYSQLGYKYIEAYPDEGELTNAQRYHGPMDMYIKEGFFRYKINDKVEIVRKAL